MRLRCGEELFDVQLREAKGEWQAVVNGQPLRLSLRSTGAGRCQVQDARQTVTLHFARDGALTHERDQHLQRSGVQAAHGRGSCFT